ncbi:MAG: serine hydrolase domain-containing protein [Mariniblastus sp.]
MKSLFVLCAIGVFGLARFNSVIAQQSSIAPAGLKVVSPEEAGMSSAKLANVDSAMEESVKQKLIAGGIVVIARHGKVVHFKSYGQRDIAAGKPMENDTIVRIYSMTKAITTTAAMMLYDEGKLHFDDPVSKFIPELKNVQVAVGDKLVPLDRAVTVADLMRHTAGYSYGYSKQELHNKAYAGLKMLDTTVTLEEFGKKLGRLPLTSQPGTDWEYGISIDVLGRVVEVASGEKLEVFFKKRIFEPLGMPDTGFYVPAEKAERFAANYNSDGKGNLTLKDDPTTSRYLKIPPFSGGGGGLVSTASDYMRFLLMIAGGGELDDVRLLKPETVKLMTTNQVPKAAGWVKFGGEIRTGVGFGFGFNVRDKMSDWDPDGRVGEYGWGGAASTHYWISPTDNVVVVTLEQIMPYSFLTENKLKGIVFDAIKD